MLKNILVLCGPVLPMTGQRPDGPQVIEIALAVEGDPLEDFEALIDVRCVLKAGVEVYPMIEQHRPKPLGGCPNGAYQKTRAQTDLALQETAHSVT